MKNGWSRWIAVVAAVALVAVPALAVVETVKEIEPDLRPELIHTDPPLQPTSDPGIFEDPHREDPRPQDPRDGFDDPRFDLPERYGNELLEDLRIERDGRPHSDGSPRMKDLTPGPRRR